MNRDWEVGGGCEHPVPVPAGFSQIPTPGNAFFSAPLVCFSPNPVVARGDQQGWTESFTSAGHHDASCLKAHPSLPPETVGLVSFCPAFHGDSGGPEAVSQGNWGSWWSRGLVPLLPGHLEFAGWYQDKSVSLGRVSSHLGTSCAPSETLDSADGEHLRAHPSPPARADARARLRTGSSPHRNVTWDGLLHGCSPARLPPGTSTGVVCPKDSRVFSSSQNEAQGGRKDRGSARTGMGEALLGAWSLGITTLPGPQGDASTM